MDLNEHRFQVMQQGLEATLKHVGSEIGKIYQAISQLATAVGGLHARLEIVEQAINGTAEENNDASINQSVETSENE